MMRNRFKKFKPENPVVAAGSPFSFFFFLLPLFVVVGRFM